MMNVKHGTIDFNTVAKRVTAITSTESTKLITKENQSLMHTIEGFSEHGFSSLGKMVGFPAQFITELGFTNPELAAEVVKDRVQRYFSADGSPFYARSFCGEVSGIVSNRYAYFDDNQVIDILEGSPLADMGFQNTVITPERLHLRAIDTKNPFTIQGDDSELFFAYFIDNSMVGRSAFKVQLGIYRLACTNGMIVPVREFVICRQIHRLSSKDIAAEFNESIAFLAEKQENIKSLITGMSEEQATIETMKEEFHESYLAKKLNLNKKETQKVINLYQYTYGGKTKWAMANAVTEFARDLKDINRREYLERAAFRAA